MWLFLGDSLTEGIGSKRISYVDQLAEMMRGEENGPIHILKLRSVEWSHNKHLSPSSGSRRRKHAPPPKTPDMSRVETFSGRYNFAGRDDFGESVDRQPIWVINLAAEATTIVDDLNMLPILTQWDFERIFILRGPLESIVRPKRVLEETWPVWIPRHWRRYAGLDPRCYFSTTWWRMTKQRVVDVLKQAIRLKWLAEGGASLVSDQVFIESFVALLNSLRIDSETKIVVLSIPPVDSNIFPGTMDVIDIRNERLRDACQERGIVFFNWTSRITAEGRGIFYRDGFHPNIRGSQLLAELLFECINSKELNVLAATD